MAEPGDGKRTTDGNYVLLLKAPKDQEKDAFVDTLKDAGYRPVLVPVLTFKFVNQKQLRAELQNDNTLAGVIFTSPRSVHAVSRAVSSVTESGGSFDPSSMRCFVVGQATSAAAQAAGFVPEGKEAGNAEVLAKIILERVDKEEPRPLLFPCAQMRRDTLIEELAANDCKLKEIVVYETGPSERLHEDIAQVMKTQGIPQRVVFFSPSGVQFVEPLVEQGILPLTRMKVYALGPTTEKALIARGYPVDGVAAKPDPASLLHLLKVKQVHCK